MLKLRALNTEYSSDEDAPGIRKEAQEEIALDLYNKALRLQCNNNYDEAKDTLYQLLNENIPLLESQGGLPKTMSTIKYSCYMNIGRISIKQKNEKEALDNFLTASELDKTDVTLWYKIGMLALKLDKFQQATYAFAQGLECSERHWPCLDQLISILFSLQETVACLQYIDKALNLDPYYVKGVVLRNQIYKDNPATEEYFKLFSGDLKKVVVDYDITEEDEATFLKDARILTDKINEAEKLLAPKSLATIPLPRGLKDFTWVELGRTITELHQYLTTNNMTHITKIDIKRCMSNDGTTLPVIEVPVETTSEEINDLTSENTDNNKDVEMSEVAPNEKAASERRPSQNSENDADNTSVTHTENEDMGQETDDQPEQDESRTPKQDSSRSAMKSSKRKRDLVSDLQIWGWHSKRKATKRAKTDKDYRIEDALTRIIPIYLIPNGLPSDNLEIFEDSRSPIDALSNDDQSARTDSYFGSDEETKDVRQFWSRNWVNRDVIDLLEAFVHVVANLWDKKWPMELVDLYVNAYNMFREHASHPPLYDEPIDFEILKKDALSTVLFAELISHTNNKKYLEEEIHCTSVNQLTMLSGWETYWGEDYLNFATRVQWLRAHLFKQKNQNNLAIMALELIHDAVSYAKLDLTTFKLTIPNNEKHHIINNAIIEAMLSKLELVDSLSKVEDLFEKQAYKEVAEILKLTFNSSNAKVTYGKIGRQAQLGILMHSLWYINQSECFIWTEKCLHEALKYVIKPVTDFDKWEMIVEKCLLIMYELIKTETLCIIDILPDDKRCRLVETLATLCRKQINTDQTRMPMQNFLPYPWILLHYILLRDEHRQQAKKVINHISKEERSLDTSRFEDDDDLPASIAILFSAHEFLGPKGWCLAKQGELLHFMLDSIIYKLDAPILEPHRDRIDIHLEQAFFCLYQHPCKKNKVSRHLADHNVNPLPLTWDRAQQLYEYFCPEALPEFDSYKSISISSDLEQLLQRVNAIIPKECDPLPMLPKINEYIHGTVSTLPAPLDFPARIKAIYYLLGDYYFKQSELKRSYKFFLLDLCINPSRIDSWAGLSLEIHSQLESKLNRCERFNNEMDFIEKAKSAKICFQEALKLNDGHVTLWIEFGSFEYMVHSFCSRVLKYESENLSMEKFEALETEKESYLESSSKSFRKALDAYQADQSGTDERWLIQYMLAKIAEKKQADPKVYHEHYMQAGTLLHENKCQYPEKINYNNPQHLSLEALEIHYRINASILKYLEAHEGKNIPISMGKWFKKCLDSSVIQKSKYEAKGPSKVEVGQKNDDENIQTEVKKLVEELLDKVEKTEKDSGRSERESDSDDVVIIESDKDEDVEREEVMSYPKIKVRNIQDMMKESLEKANEQKPIDPTEITAPTTGVTVEAIAKSGDDRSEQSEKDGRSEDEGNIRKSTTTTTATEDSSSSSSSSSSTSSSESESDDSSTSTDSSSENMSENEVLNLVDRCIVGLEHCIRRLPQNYKALYRLAHVYYTHSKRKDLNKCKQLLLGEYKCKNSVLVTGLFSDRKATNFFNGIWRIPSNEIDRPGSLSAHMSRCVTLLLQVLRDTQDHKILFELSIQWSRVPEPDKIYIRHSEREQLSEDALTMSVQILRTQLKEFETMTPANAERLVIDLFKAYQRSQKNLSHMEKTFSTMLVDGYKKLMGDKQLDSSNVLELAVKYCQQIRIPEKVKRQFVPAVSPKPMSTIPIPTQPPIVQSSPSNLNIAPIPPLKRPSLGRPRGRPPGTTKLNQTKSPRGRSPLTNPYSWSNPLFTPTAGLDYMKHYQDELLRQYSQKQFSNLFTAGMGLSSSTAASALLGSPSSSTVSNPLLNATLLQSMQQLASGLNSSNQLGMNQVNPNLLKQTLDALNSQMAMTNSSQMLAGLSTEQLLQLAALGQQSNKPTKPIGVPKPKSKQHQHVPQKGQVHPTASMQGSGFKYPTAEVKRKQQKQKVTAGYTSGKDIPPAHSASASGLSLEKPKALMKDRPGISITPIVPPIVPAGSPGSSNPTMPTSSSPGKTLQEKLADKQKQQKQAAKSLDFSAVPPSTSSALPFPVYPTPADYKSFQNVIPNYLLESGLSISQVQQKNSKAPTSQQTSKQSSKQSVSNMPISMSVVKQPTEKKSKPPADDDVIIIE